jgi:hypothetical protein
MVGRLWRRQAHPAIIHCQAITASNRIDRSSQGDRVTGALVEIRSTPLDA